MFALELSITTVYPRVKVLREYIRGLYWHNGIERTVSYIRGELITYVALYKYWYFAII